MPTNITLTLDSQLVEQAEAYAQKQGMSLSALVEDVLKTLPVVSSSGPLELSPQILALMGSVKLPEGMTYEQVRDEYLTNKYLK